MNTKEKILELATELFLKEGVKRVTMDYLASQLGMSKRTVYEQFKNKDELLKSCINSLINKQRLINEKITSESETAMHGLLAFLMVGLENIRIAKPYFATDVRKYYPAIWKSTMAINHEYGLQKVTLMLNRGISEGVFRDDLKINFTAKLFMEQITIISDTDIFPISEYPSTELFQTLIVNFARGIASSKGLGIIDSVLPKIIST
jgi:TetR/AcrR family transcriptional regulator, cholesterol catabolism regulator